MARMQDQKWTVRTKSGDEFTINTAIGVGPQQAVETAGYMMGEIDYIRPDRLRGGRGHARLAPRARLPRGQQRGGGPVIPGRTQRRVLAVLAAAKVMDASYPERSTSNVVECLPDTPSRKKVVTALRELEEAAYVAQTRMWVHGLQGTPGGQILAWRITPDGLRVALGVLS